MINKPIRRISVFICLISFIALLSGCETYVAFKSNKMNFDDVLNVAKAGVCPPTGDAVVNEMGDVVPQGFISGPDNWIKDNLW